MAAALTIKSKPKIFIVGISGFLGYQLAQRLKKDFLVVGIYFTHHVHIPDVQCFPVSMKNIEALETLIRVHAPDFVINAMGVTDKKVVVESEKLSDNMNVAIPLSMAVLSVKLKCKFVQLSCADVYEGIDGNYSEDTTDFTLTDVFGKQKITAESYIRSQTLESTTFRIGRVMGIGNPYRSNFFDRRRILLAKGNMISVPKNCVHSYISIHSFLNAVEMVLKSEIPPRHRIFNLGGANISEYEFWKGWVNLLEYDQKLLKEDTESNKRDLSMISKNFEQAYPNWKQETKEQIYLNILKDMAPGLGVKKSLAKRLEAK